MSALASLTIGARAIVLTLASLRASRYVHDQAIKAVIAAPMSFFDTTPLGRILNRFSIDLQKVGRTMSTHNLLAG